MPIRANKPLAREHFRKALEYYFDCDRRAIKHANIAIAQNLKWSRPHWLLGLIYSTVEPIDLEEAIREYREVIVKEPQWPMGHYNLGRILSQQGRIDEAMAAQRQALRLEPEAIRARVELARCLLKRCDYREAITVLRGRPSLSFHYTLADAHLLLAEALMNSHYGIEQARAEWEFILGFDASIPAYRVAQDTARRRLLETEKR
jgi:tetratricopeptide (TPR) repeat protein